MRNEPISKLLLRLWHKFSPHRRGQFFLLLILMLIASFAEILSIGTVLPFLAVLTSPERVFEHSVAQPFIKILGLTKPSQLLLPLTIIFGLGAILSGAMRLLFLWASTRLSFAAGADLSISIYRRTLYQSYAVHCARNSSEVISGISSKTGSVIYNTLLPVLTLISASVTMIAILMALLSVEPMIALGAFGGFGLIYVIIIRLTRKRLLADSQCVARESVQVLKSLHEGLGGIRDVLIDGSQATYCQIYRNADLPLRRAQGSSAFIGASPRYAMEALGMLLIAGLAYALAVQSDGISKAIPILGALALGAQRLLPILQQAYVSWVSIQSGQVALEDTLSLLDQALPDYADKPPAQPLPFNHNISLKQLAFRYSPQTPYVLENINLNITRGSRVGFIGTTGSGKSTLLDIVMGLLQPTEGSLEVDGQTISLINNRAWQAHIAQAQIAESVESWPKKYQTIVGERGIRISGGQRQRIGIARALYKQADVIIFDEATSALDNETEQAVMQAIDGLSDNLTILIIAHRLTTLQNCTQIVELGDGGIKRNGSYLDVVSKNNKTMVKSKRNQT